MVLFVRERCFKLHRLMFTILGLWPYQNSCIWRLQAVFFFSVYSSFLIFQLTTFLTSTCNIDCIFKKFSYICITIAYITNYYSFYFNSETVKQSLEHIQLDWKMLETSETIKIFEEYLFEAYILALSAYITLIVGSFVLISFESTSVILDAFIPINESRPRKLEVDFELFVDQEEYFFLYLIQEMLGVGIGMCSVIATGTFLATIGKHCCATYKIASYLIQNTVTIHTLQLPAPQRMQIMHRSICLSVHIHRRTMQFCKRILISFHFWYFPLLIIGVLSLSCVLFRLYNAIMQFNDFYEILISCLLLYCYLIYMFVGNFIAHSYSEHSGRVLEAMYDTLWYVAPLPIQKLFLIMQKSIQNHKLVMGGLFVLSIEGFSTLITSAVSYFTVMHAMNDHDTEGRLVKKI
ncbi:hypothetical protein DMN91_009909 [Ooceraea biroi]|uniref:Odorant receptor n=1 Tax=Ooceraea biroi TaxID=2015173 RepID=A0A026VVX7_OOCBI|nr:uncharacterized protein LOC105286027 [Ooceraea biroi]EZA47917.1 hypothetical protein X777_14486 [Ooceraea biroi]RLU17673.1 hypothetical protein DMN91_009909 [Ooceraea biroi]